MVALAVNGCGCGTAHLVVVVVKMAMVVAGWLLGFYACETRGTYESNEVKHDSNHYIHVLLRRPSCTVAVGLVAASSERQTINAATSLRAEQSSREVRPTSAYLN
jgi:hypothetical protein